MGSAKNTTSQTTTPNATAMGAYNALIPQIQAVGSTPYQPYTGQLVAPANWEQAAGIGNTNQYATYALPYVNTAETMAQQAAQPITAADIQQYENPFTQQVVGSTEAQFANQNQQQLEAVQGNAISQGAMGGNREAIAEAETTNQQQLAQAPVIAGLESQGYTQGVNTALTEQQALASGAYSVGSLGVAGENAALQGAGQQYSLGTQLQTTQQARDTAQYQQYLQQLAYPYQSTGWEASQLGGVGSLMGGTSQTVGPAPSIASQVAGAGTLAYGLGGQSGLLSYLATGGAVHGYADGGGVANREPTIPETRETLYAQQKQLVEGHRRVQMFPHGTPEIPVPRGFSRIVIHGDAFHYDPKRIDPHSIRHLAEHERHNEFLDLGPFSKHEVMHRAHGGEVPVAVVERDRNGTEVRAAAGTHTTAHHQLAAMHRTKSPGHTVQIEDPRHTLARRLHRHRADGGRVPGFAPGGGVAMPYTFSPTAGGMPYPMRLPSTPQGQPYTGGVSYVPASQPAHGHGPPNYPPNLGNQPSNIAQQAKGIGQLGQQIQLGLNQPTNITPSGGGYVPSSVGTIVPPAAGVVPTSSADAIYHHGGSVGRYASGGIANLPARNRITVPRGYADGGSPDQMLSDVNASLPPWLTDAASAPAGVAPPPTVIAPPVQPMDHYANIIAAKESGGDYGAVGPKDPKSGSVPLGKYQVMDYNVGPWTKAALGTEMSPQEFLQNPDAQDAVFRHKFGEYTDKYGPSGAARAWFAGPGGMNNPNARDVLGTSVGDYGADFDRRLGYSSEGPTGGLAPPPTSAPLDISNVTVASPQGVAPTGIDWSANSKLWPALITAGAGMMASRSPFPGVAIGEGALAGAQTYATERQQEINERVINAQARKLSIEAETEARNLDALTKMRNEDSGVSAATPRSGLTSVLPTAASAVPTLAPSENPVATLHQATQAASNVAAVHQTPQGPVAVDSGGKPVMNPNHLLATAQRYIQSGVPAYQSAGEKMMSLYETMISKGVTTDENGNVIPVPGAAETGARAAGLKKEAEAPFEIAQAAIREGGRPIAVAPNQVVTTGADTSPALRAAQDWAISRLPGVTGAPAAPSTTTAPGAVQTVPAPAAAAPATSNPLPLGQPSEFAPRLIRNPDGSVSSSVTPAIEEMQKDAAKKFEKAGDAYANAQDIKMRLGIMRQDADQLNASGWSTTGSGETARVGLAKTINSIAATFGANPVFDPKTVGSWESLNKQTTQMGFELARTLGSREAMMIVQQATSSVPNAENTPTGFRLVSSAIEQQVQRQADYYQFARDYMRSHGGDTVGAEIEFNKANPPTIYSARAIANGIVDPRDKAALLAHRDNPAAVAAINKKYGNGIANTLLTEPQQ